MQNKKSIFLLINVFCNVFANYAILEHIPHYSEIPNNGAKKCISSNPDRRMPSFGEIVKRNMEARNNNNVNSGNGNFHYQLQYKNGIPSTEEFTNMYYSIQFTPQTTLRREHYYAFYTPIGYTGFQPHSETEMNLVFSSFSPDSSVVDTTLCFNGADGGAGTSCSNLLTNFKPFDIYIIRIQKTGYAQYAAHLLDNFGNELLKIGEYKFSNYTAITAVDDSNWNSGFIESFVDNSWPNCCDIMRAQAFIFGPFSSDDNGAYATSFTFDKYGTTCSEQEMNLGYTNFNVSVLIPGSYTLTKSTSSLISLGWLN